MEIMKACEKTSTKCTLSIYISLQPPHRSIFKMKNICNSFKIQWMSMASFIIDIYALKKVSENFYFQTLTIGMAKVVQKYLEGIYGYCPRALCNNQKCLPVGLSDKLRSSRVKIFCPKCDEVYMVQKYKSGQNGQPGGVQTSTNLDGAYFGTSFP